jgi:signal peptidase I
MATNLNKIISAVVLTVPPVIFLHDKFYSTCTVKNDLMEPALKKDDVVLVRKFDFFPFYQKSGLEIEDLEDAESNGPKIDEETDRIKTLRMDRSVGRMPISQYTIWSSPPTSLPGDIVVFKNPQTFLPFEVEMKRLIGLGGQRVR